MCCSAQTALPPRVHPLAESDQLLYHPETGDVLMLETLVVILLVLWLLGLVSSVTMGGFIHVLLVIAVVVILIRLIRGRI